jgi:porphobilinogen synthase
MPEILYRPRRLRASAGIRNMVRETQLSVHDFVYPIFVVPGINIRKEIPSLPGQYHLSADQALETARQAAALGIPAVLLFGLPEYKDAKGSSAWDMKSPVQRAMMLIKKALPDLVIIGDVCLCEYTDHGHCGLLKGQEVDNDPTLDLLARVAVSQAKAGADVIAPSDMMDGRVAAIREALDVEGFAQRSIMAYSAKYASAFYGPFREAADSAPKFGDRRAYQMDPANVREAMREVDLDVSEGADIIMVKPAMAYMDVISKVRDGFELPVAAYNVSGEYAMVKAAAANGWMEEQRTTLEILTGIKRAGADIIITYHALEAAAWLR